MAEESYSARGSTLFNDQIYHTLLQMYSMLYKIVSGSINRNIDFYNSRV